MPNRTKNYSEIMPKRIKSLRETHRLTQKSLADKLYKSESTVRMWELGKSEPDSETINNLSTLFNVSTDYILGKPFKLQKPKNQWHFSQIEDYNNASEAEKEYILFKHGLGVFDSHETEKKSLNSNDDIKVALFGGDTEVTDEMWEEVMNYAEYIKQKYGKT